MRRVGRESETLWERGGIMSVVERKERRSVSAEEENRRGERERDRE